MRRMLVISDGPFSGSGFSEELRHILFRLVQTGQFEVFWFSLQHVGYPFDINDSMFEDIPHKGAKITILGHRPRNIELFGAEHFPKHWATVSPDFVLFMGDPRNITPYVIGNPEKMDPTGSLKQRLGFPLYMYVTLDGLPVHPMWVPALKQINALIAMTEWAQVEYMKAGLSPAFIYHGINWQWWKTNDNERLALRKKYGIPLDCTIVMNWEVNQHRKRQDALLRAWRDTHPETKNMKLILYTDWQMGNSLGWDLEELIIQEGVPRNTILSPLQLQKSPKFWEVPERPETLLEIAKLGDFYISATSGEGFGKCGLEAMSLGMPVIITDYAASSEIHKKGSILIPITGTYRMQDRMRSVHAGLIDEHKMAEAIEELYYNNKKRMELGIEAREWARNFDYDTQIVPQWVNLLLNEINPDEIMLRELLKT